MIIGLNGRFLTKPYTGIGQYTRYLFQELAHQNPDDTLVVVVPTLKVPDGTFKVGAEFPANVKIVVVREKLIGTAGMKKTHWEQVKLPRFFRKHNVDIVHYPYPSNPWKGFEKPVVVTVHDTIPWELPEYRRSFLTRLYQDRARNAVKKADRIVTVSEVSKRAIVNCCGVRPEDVTVIHNAPAPHFLQPLSDDKKTDALKRYGIDPSRKFFLYVGGYDARKNVSTLVDVYLRSIACQYEVDLVLVGEKSLNDHLYSSFDDTEEHQKEHASKRKGKMVLTGFVAESDMPALYQAALAFVNVSTIEGFNLTLVQSAVSHTPMVVSNIPVHHEVIGSYALYADPSDKKGLTAFMKRLVTDQSFYTQQKEHLEQYECPYLLEESARALKKLYESL